MEHVTLGRTGLRVSRVCLGMMSFGRSDTRPWAIGEDEAEPIVRRAVEGGITFFDTADVYNEGQSEVVTGRLLKKLFGMREEYVLATKVRMTTMPGENGSGLSRKHVLASIDASLQRLGLEQNVASRRPCARCDLRYGGAGGDGAAVAAVGVELGQAVREQESQLVAGILGGP